MINAEEVVTSSQPGQTNFPRWCEQFGRRRTLLLATLLFPLAACEVNRGMPRPTTIRTTHLVTLPTGGTLTFAMVRPGDFDSSKTYPVVLAFPPGVQNGAMVAYGLNQYWDVDNSSGQWIVVSPGAPTGTTFEETAAAYVPFILDSVEVLVPHVEGGKFHMSGFSNGGLGAFEAALNYPERTHSLFVFPGGPSTTEDSARMNRLVGIPVRMMVGANDEDEWIALSEETNAALQALGIDSELEIREGQGHVIYDLTSSEIYEILEALREQVMGTLATARTSASGVRR
jgi:hypothetical protein